MGKLSIIHVNSGEWINSLSTVHFVNNGDGGKWSRRRRKGGGRKGATDGAVALTVAVLLVILLPNKVAVRWGAASPTDNFFLLLLCVYYLYFFFLFFLLSCLSLFDFAIFSRPLLCFSTLKILCFSFLFFPLCFVLSPLFFSLFLFLVSL